VEAEGGVSDAVTYIDSDSDRLAYLSTVPGYQQAMQSPCSQQHLAVVERHVAKHGNPIPPSLAAIRNQMEQIVEAEKAYQAGNYSAQELRARMDDVLTFTWDKGKSVATDTKKIITLTPKKILSELETKVYEEKLRREARKRVDKEEQSQAVELVLRSPSLSPSKPQGTFGKRLWRGCFIPVVGKGEVGKGFISYDLIARFTSGEPFPGETERRDPMRVLICASEDAEDMITWRLKAAGADLDNVKYLGGPPVLRGGLAMPSGVALDDDAGALVKVAREQKAEVLFLETILSHLGDREGKRRIDTNNEMSVRRAFAPVSAACQAGNLYGFGIIHPRKGTDGVVDDAISGSGAFRNVPRSILYVFQDPTDTSKDPVRLLGSNKANYLRHRPPTLRCRIEPWEDDPDLGRVVWGIEEQGTLVDTRSVEDIWDQVREKNKKQKPRSDRRVAEAEEFLQRLVAVGNGMTPPVKELKKLAADEGLSWQAIKDAKANLQLVSIRAKEPQAPVLGWKLPEVKDDEL
jgi:hypothetical protein